MTSFSEKLRLAEFFRTEYDKLIGFVRRRVDYLASRDAEDFVHDVAVQLFDRADFTVPIEHLSAYVYRSLQNRIADYFRRRRPDQIQTINNQGEKYPSIEQVIESSGYDVAPETRQMEIAHDLYKLLDGLKDEEKGLIIAVDILGYTFGHLSKIWDIPVNTLISRKARALGKIQQQIRDKTKKEEENL